MTFNSWSSTTNTQPLQINLCVNWLSLIKIPQFALHLCHIWTNFLWILLYAMGRCARRICSTRLKIASIPRGVSLLCWKSSISYFHKQDMTKVQSEASEIGTESESMDVCLYVSFSSLTYELLICIQTIRKREYHWIKMWKCWQEHVTNNLPINHLFSKQVK